MTHAVFYSLSIDRPPPLPAKGSVTLVPVPDPNDGSTGKVTDGSYEIQSVTSTPQVNTTDYARNPEPATFKLTGATRPNLF